MVIIKDIENSRIKISLWRNNFDPAKIEEGGIYSFSRLVVDKFPPEKPYYLQHAKTSIVKPCTDERIRGKFLSIEISDGNLEGNTIYL